MLIKTRQAADRLGATMMDRPEWGAVHPETREVYMTMTMTNNSRRGNTPASSNNPKEALINSIWPSLRAKRGNPEY